MDEGTEVQFIDIRPPIDFELVRIPGAINIPKAEISENLDKIDPQKMIIVYCRFGIKSTSVARDLRENHQISKAYALREGLLEWAIDIDPDMPKDLI